MKYHSVEGDAKTDGQKLSPTLKRRLQKHRFVTVVRVKILLAKLHCKKMMAFTIFLLEGKGSWACYILERRELYDFMTSITIPRSTATLWFKKA